MPNFELRSLILITACVVTSRALIKRGAPEWLLKATKYEGVDDEYDDCNNLGYCNEED